MDVLKPELVWIDNRCYRKFHIKESENKAYIEDELYPPQREEYEEEEEEEEAERLPIKYENQKFWISLPVPGPLIGYVCGKQSNNIKRIEDSTGVKIKIPSRLNGGGSRYKSKNERSSDFVITADKGPSVSQAYKRLKEIMISGRWKVADYTHFVSIPVNCDSIQEKFSQFREEVLRSCHSARGIKEAIFTNPSKLHLTIAMLTLLDEREKEEAKAALNDCQREIVKILAGRRLHIEVKGIEYMNDDDAEVDVLFGKVGETDGNNVLQIIAEKIAGTFSNMNLAPPSYNVKLHVTLLKSRSNGDERNSFDARPLLQKFEEYPFGEMEWSEIHISTRHTGYDKYYTPLAFVKL